MAQQTRRPARRSRGRLAAASVAFAALVLGASGPVLAAGAGDDGGSTGFSNRDTSPGQKAISEYKSGEKRLDRARELRLEIVEAQEQGDAKRVAKLEKKLRGAYEQAEKSFRKALDHDDGLFQAWSSLGYTLRHLDRFDEALEAYDSALALEPRYAEAVEYRAEAYLELGRLEDAKAGYEQLVGWVRPMAERLMVKMEAWVELKSQAPGGLAPEQVAAFAAWVDERKAADGTAPTVSAAERAAW